jgi:predicted O-methyltransferase YrrM
VDVQRFLDELPGLFDGFPEAEHPRDRRLAPVLEEVPGLARENNLALLNLAASLLPEGESYVEIGTFRGTSLISAMLGNEGKEFVGIDDFSFRDGSVEELEANLRRFGLDRPTILVGDAFELVPGGELEGRRIGVYYYDNGHEYAQQLEALRMIEPYLADHALVIVDDSDWERVSEATRVWLDEQPRAELLLDIPGDDRGNPAWWQGMWAIGWTA